MSNNPKYTLIFSKPRRQPFRIMESGKIIARFESRDDAERFLSLLLLEQGENDAARRSGGSLSTAEDQGSMPGVPGEAEGGIGKT